MKRSNSTISKILVSFFTIGIFLFVFAPNVFAQSTSLGEQLSEELITSKDTIRTWNEFSDTEKAAVKSFAEQAKDEIAELENKDLDNSELKNEIQKLPSELQTAIHVSLLAVNKEVEISKPENNLNASHSISQIIRFEAIWGNTVAKFTHNITWYTSGSRVTSGYRSAIPDTPGLGWSYDGLIRDVKSTTSSAYNSDVQGSFSYDISSVNIQNWYPRSQIVGYANGSYRATDYN